MNAWCKSLLRRKNVFHSAVVFLKPPYKQRLQPWLSFRQLTWIQGRHCQWQVWVWRKKIHLLADTAPLACSDRVWAIQERHLFFHPLTEWGSNKTNSRPSFPCVFFDCECWDPHIPPRQPKMNGVRTPGDALWFRGLEQRTQKLQVLMLGQPTTCQVTLYNPPGFHFFPSANRKCECLKN